MDWDFLSFITMAFAVFMGVIGLITLIIWLFAISILLGILGLVGGIIGLLAISRWAKEMDDSEWWR